MKNTSGSSRLFFQCLFFIGLCSGVGISTAAEQKQQRMEVDISQVSDWNGFSEALFALHKKRMQGREIKTTEHTGGYGGRLGEADFYKEISYIDADTGRLLSKIQWEREHPDTIHTIEVFIYDNAGRVTRDFLAAYLPWSRNAPVQTLINLHYYNGELHGFRQFDASGERIYEQCSGKSAGEDVFISLEDYELNTSPDRRPHIMSTRMYEACFGDLQKTAGAYTTPQ